ncbi:universal stress protein [Paenibacillus larvae]|uniref:UspA domain-containing protein n=4 Tax=Paenibacillus larvae TaxID=1464 RepID=V9W8K4_9BACL|nr:universal stress protein [Paenibacillus larvae]AHD07356.1 hypothetical protein ERIC2_c36390 [Paenibacillus larvae subsp. larvae DSM 25430]AQR79174.1 hypothetical protein BXP28_20040 [Paenibacillus larvae subsp. larvae]AQT85527.1 hypothetical protein B1222_15755 [Paenibacillus larvae subsp. pulvifaciens]AQZ47534.1 hypothetical protein B5S25_14065 [Paenibacillus larvae subsp. pulvifaciens]ARF68836.1 hypothetical protein B7C51_15090 [Paenibacillus larvae subsp. pulvifaciens]
MCFQHVLVAYDGSNLSKKALKKAAEYAKRDPDIALEVIHVLYLPSSIMGSAFVVAPPTYEEEIEQETKQMLQEIREELKELPNPVKVELLKGNPAEQILKHTEAGNYDLIVMGSRGLGPIREFILGSVSHNVVQRAKIPVLIVK